MNVPPAETVPPAEPTPEQPAAGGSTPSELTRAVADIDIHLEQAGWDQPVRLYALVETADLLAREPHLAESLGLGVDAAPGALTPIEQEDLPEVELDELLATIMWPPEVLGVAVSHEVLSLPPEVELPEGDIDVTAWVAQHEQREEIRLTVGVLRDGQRACAIRRRGTFEVLVGADLAPNLAAALDASLQD